METGSVSKRQQPDLRAENSPGPPMGLQCGTYKLSILHRFTNKFSIQILNSKETYI